MHFVKEISSAVGAEEKTLDFNPMFRNKILKESNKVVEIVVKG